MMFSAKISADFLRGVLVFTLVSVSKGQQDISVKPEEDVVLQCQRPRGENIHVLKWIRPDLKSDGYVFFYRNKRSFENYQHPFFRGRVELRDPEMKDGDASVILKNITINDGGIYECYVSGRSKRTHSENIHFINLTVTVPGHTYEDLPENPAMIGEDTDGSNQLVLKEENISNMIVPDVCVYAGIIGFVGLVVLVGTVMFSKVKHAGK